MRRRQGQGQLHRDLRIVRSESGTARRRRQQRLSRLPKTSQGGRAFVRSFGRSVAADMISCQARLVCFRAVLFARFPAPVWPKRQKLDEEIVVHFELVRRGYSDASSVLIEEHFSYGRQAVGRATLPSRTAIVELVFECIAHSFSQSVSEPVSRPQSRADLVKVR